MTVEFDINETGTFDVVYNASISIPNETVTVSSGKLILHPPVGDYIIYSITITNVADSNCTYTYNPDIVIDCLAPCGCSQQNFTILSVTNTSGSTYRVTFDACRVNPIHAEVFNGGSVIFTTDISPATNPFSINLSSITTNGVYKLKLSSPNCVGTAELNFTVGHNGGGGGEPQEQDLIFVVNATGVALDFNAPERHYISNNQVQLITDALTGANSEAVDAIRLPFIWGEYNPSNGVYKNTQLGEAIDWVRSLRPLNPPQVDLLFVPISYGNDTRIPANELAVDNNQNLQDCTYNSLFTTVPSYYSPTATTLIGQALDSLIPYLQANHGTSIRMMELAAGQSEEHYMPFTTQYGGNNCGEAFSGIGDYSTGASLPAWRSFLLGRFGLGILPFNINGSAHTATSAPLPNVGVTVGNNDNMNYSQQAYRELFRFYSEGIFGIWKRFHDKVKSLSTFKTGYVIPDLLNEQGTKWLFHGGTIWLAMKYADQFYHTHNISTSEWEANLWGADVQLGSFPNQNKIPAIEFDNIDAGAANGANLNTSHVSSVILRFIKNGGKVVHTALGWTTNQMNQWKSLIKTIKAQIASPSFVLENRSTAVTVNVDSNAVFNNPYVYKQAWISAGNSTGSAAYNAVPVNISINNNGNVDGFWLEGGIPVPGTGGSGGSGGGTSASVQRTAKINIVKTGSTYSDTTSDTDGIFVAYYYVNNVPYKDGSGNRAKFLNESFTAGIPITVSKAFVNPAYFPDWNSMENNMNIAAFSGGIPAAINSYEQHSFITT